MDRDPGIPGFGIPGLQSLVAVTYVTYRQRQKIIMENEAA